jgi:branched-chain amino acid transport system substrate-binding protein
VATPTSPLKIGVLVPYTESSIGADIGLNQKRAADLYLKQHNGKLGSRSVNIVYSAESIEVAINKVKVNTLLTTEKAEILLGGARDETAVVMRDAADAAKVVYIDTNATADALTRSKASKYVFRTSASSWQLSAPLGQWAARKGLKEFFVCAVNDATGAEFADAFVSGLGTSATGRTAFPNGGDWSKAIAQIKAQPTKNVFAAFDTDDAEGFLNEWTKQGMSQAGFSLYGPGLLTEQPVLDATAIAAEGAVTAYFWSAELDNPENKALVGAFPREYTEEETGAPVALSGYAVEMWDAMTALDLALKETNNTNSLVAALEKVSFKSPRGGFSFDRSHNPVQDIVIRQAKTNNGRLANVVLDMLPKVADAS